MGELTWADFPWRINPGRPTRFMYGDGDDLNYVDLPAPILHVAPGPWAVTLQCADGGIYVLWSRTTPADVDDGWMVTLVWKR